MRRLPKLLLLSLLALAAAVPAARAIVGGTPVPTKDKYPFVARIEIQPGLQCTGTLIAPTWVMTAGHCSSLTGVGAPSPIPMVPQAYTVFLGGIKTDGSDSKTYSVKAVHVPPGYSVQNGSGRDVGLLELSEPVTGITPLKIAAASERASWAAGAPVIAAGFGVTESGGEQPEVMQEVTLPVVSDADCATAYPNGTPVLEDGFIKEVDVCAGDLVNGGKDSCQGDSGGPLMSTVGTGLRLVGATSRGNGCAEPGFPGIYARIAEGELKDFVKGLVPDAYAAETPPSAGTATPTATATATLGTTPVPSATVTPTTTASRTCAGRSGLRLRFGKRIRNVRIRTGGKSILKKRGSRKAFTVDVSGRLRADGRTRVRVFTRSAKGTRRVTVRTYDRCQQTGVRKRVKR